MSDNDTKDHDTTTQPPPAKRARKSPQDEAAQAKNRACHSCRRAKLRCVVLVESEPCRRCSARNEECRFKIPLHDEKWQEETSSSIDALRSTMNYLVQAVEAISRHLDLPFEVPPAGDESPHRSPSSSVLASTGPATIELPPVSVQRSDSGTQRRRIHDHDYLTQSGAEQLLSQAYASFSPPVTTTEVLHPSPTASAHSKLPPGPANSGFFGLLDDFDWSEGPRIQGAVTSTYSVGSNSDAVGSQDPRSDCVKSGIVPSHAAEDLVDYFHSHLGQHMFGFPFRLRSWPYQPSGGRATMTPLILGSICLIGSERIRAYHDLLPRLVASSLRESIMDVEPGNSFAPLPEGYQIAGQNQPEPDLDLELGIGPEEISALLIFATLSCSPRSDIIARTAFEITRGYLKTFMLPQPPPVTYGEVLGLLPTRRDLTFENWLRLWLFAYVVDVQQSLHHERPCPIFDPTYFCDTLILQSSSADDRELVAHARLCALLQRIQHVRLSPTWRSSSTSGTPAQVVSAYQLWNADLDSWWAVAQDLELSPSPSAVLSLTMFRFFARVYLNLAASKEPGLGDSVEKWRFREASVRAAWDMLSFVRNEPALTSLNVLLPFYIKMVTLSSIVLLDSFQLGRLVILPCSLEHGLEVVLGITQSFELSPTPLTHTAHIAAGTLRKAMQKAERELAVTAVVTGNGGGVHRGGA